MVSHTRVKPNAAHHSELNSIVLIHIISFNYSLNNIAVARIHRWSENFLRDISYFGNHSPGCLLSASHQSPSLSSSPVHAAIILVTIPVRCTASCQLHCKLPIAMQTDECRRQYEDFSLDEHAADDNGMHCDAIFNEQYAKCSPYSKMQRALKYKFTQCKP